MMKDEELPQRNLFRYAALILALTMAPAIIAPSGCEAFSTTTIRPSKFPLHHRHSNRIHASNNDGEDAGEGDREQKESRFLALPPPGQSSSGDRRHEQSSENWDENTIVSSASLVNKKFDLQYTCKVCNERNSHKVSRKAYRQGVVICVCKGCEAKHLIADNLGWSNYMGAFNEGETNIEEYLTAKGREDEFNRVPKPIFELETAMRLAEESSDSSSSAEIVDEGEAAFE